MTRDDLDDKIRIIMADVVHRRQLGGFDANASSVLLHGEMILAILQHLLDKTPRKKNE